ncbi:hypothetical protein Mro03_69820 [Microbispora rosea subsp. rosea]|nr:hypothetical protein Mro03_69820 [Microbispora rosea subsp. rosea]
MDKDAARGLRRACRGLHLRFLMHAKCAAGEPLVPMTDCYYDQHCVIGALLRLDDRLGTSHADRFLTTGLWHASAFSRLNPAVYRPSSSATVTTGPAPAGISRRRW